MEIQKENKDVKNINTNLPKQKKNHWTQSKVDEATKKISREVYEKNRQAPLQIKLDDFAILINDRITRRGIAKGLVSIQEDLNINILEVQKLILEAYLSTDKKYQYEKLMKVKQILKIYVWSDIRFLMVNKAITPRRNNRIN